MTQRSLFDLFKLKPLRAFSAITTVGGAEAGRVKKSPYERVFPEGRFRQWPVEIVRRSYQRSLNVIARPDGSIRVTANKTVSEKHIQRFLLSEIKWLEKTMQAHNEIRAKYPLKNFTYGEKFLFQGVDLNLVTEFNSRKIPKFSLNGENLICQFSPEMELGDLRAAL